jgi:hypothetical protein
MLLTGYGFCDHIRSRFDAAAVRRHYGKSVGCPAHLYDKIASLPEVPA